jgi:3-deoxy-D-manno-octulosonic-acid transferase
LLLSLSKVFYYLGIQAYGLVIAIAAFFHPKAKLWLKGRKGWQADLKAKLTEKKGDWIWLHAASLGEFEQGRPLIELIRKNYPEKRILLSFFSPSGYEVRKNYKEVDYVCYLPMDSPKNAQIWLDLLQPQMVFFIKYEFWYYYLNQLKKRGIPTYLVSGIFRPKQAFFKPWGALFREMLTAFELFFVQNEASANLLTEIGFDNSIITGDTRVDRVLAIKNEAKNFVEIDAFVGNAPVFVVGSSWPADEARYLSFLENYLIPKGWKVIIAPHEVDRPQIQQLENQLKGFKYELYTKTSNPEALRSKEMLIIDNIGMLSSLYAYARVAYVGGGFGKGIHNILEAAVYEIPVLFGPKHKKFAEAEELLNLGVAFELEQEADLYNIFEQLNFKQIRRQAQSYFEQHKHASLTILKEIKPQLSGNKS